jgi:Ca2+-binding RTX toxin-like protein
MGLRSRTEVLGSGTSRVLLTTVVTLAALAARLAFSAKPVKAGICLSCYNSAGGGGGYKWTGTNASEDMTGTSYIDMLDGQGGNDKLYGLASADSLYGGGGDDYIEGGAGDDNISVDNSSDLSTAGADTVYAGDGNDTITVPADGKKDVIDGGNGTDTVNLVPECGATQDELRNIEYVSRKGSC